MRIAFTEEQERLRAQLRGYFAGLMTPQRRADLDAAHGEFGRGTAYTTAWQSGRLSLPWMCVGTRR